MKKLILACLILTFPLSLKAQTDTLILTTILTADVKRQDEGPDIRAIITLNLVGGLTYKTDFIVNPLDVNAYKNGNASTKLSIAKKYIRQAIKNYLQSVTPPSLIDQGTSNISKAQITDPGDTQ